MDIYTQWLHKRIQLSKGNIALVDLTSKKGISYQELEEHIQMFVQYLYKKGIRKGDRVAILAPNRTDLLEIMFACGRLGALFVPLNWRLSVQELISICEDCEPKILFVDFSLEQVGHDLKTVYTVGLDEWQQEWENLKDEELLISQQLILPEDPWLLLYTGGTTGKPKGVLITHRAIAINAMNTVTSWGLTAKDVTPIYMPMFHTGGINALAMPVLFAGGTVVVASSFDPEEAIRCLQQEHCTIALFVPTMYQRLIQSPVFRAETFPTMQVFVSGGAPCPAMIYQAFAERGLPFKEGYGLTEAGPNNFYITPEEAKEKIGSVGLPMMWNDIQLVKNGEILTQNEEVGEIWLRGGHLFDSYWRRPEETAEVWHGEWFRTGDLGKRDVDGYYYIVGRLKDIIISGGENVYPGEVERVIANHPKIAEVCVVGLPDEQWGECVVAVVVPKDESIDEQELKDYCRLHLGGYKVPKRVIQLAELPKTDVGKIDKKGIINQYAHG